jgi:hypothetical protein
VIHSWRPLPSESFLSRSADFAERIAKSVSLSRFQAIASSKMAVSV